MAGKLGVLTLDLIARIGQFVEPMKNAERQTKTSAGNMARDFEEADKGISMSAKNIGLSLAGVAASYVSIDRLINTQRTFDKLNAGLITATGSAEGAAAAFDSLQKFAKETPYGLEQSVGAFIKLTNLGLKPSEAALTSYGNTAAAMGKDLDQMIEAVADATTGEFERLKEFGIKASQENGKVSLTFKGQTTTIRNNAKEIEKYLLDLGNVDFAGAMENRMKTLDGSIANLEDTIDGLFLKVSQSGIGDALKAGVDGVSESLETLGDNLDTVGDIALVVGAIFAGRYASSMVGSIQKTIAASVEQKQALVAEKAANVQLLSTQMQAARSKVGALTAEQNLLIARIRQNTNLQERIVLEARATQVAIQLAVAERQATASTAAYTAATSEATGATSRLASAKALLLGLTGGWVGLGITVASVAAGYLMMRDGADESTKSLRENNESVDDAIKKYKELDEVKRRAQLVSEKSTLQDLAKEYDEVNSKLITATYSFSRHNDMTSEQSKQVNALIAEYKKTGDIDKFSQKINSLSFVNQESKDKFNTLAGSVKTAGNEFKTQKTFVSQMEPALKGVGDQAKQTAIETASLSAEIRKLLSEANQTIKDSAITSALANRGYNDTMIELAKKYLNVEGAIVKNEQGRLSLRADLQKMFTAEYNEVMKAKNATDARNEAEKKITQEKEKQAKLTKASTIDAVISSGEGNYNSVNLGQKGGYKASTRNLTDMTVAQILSAQRAKEFNAAGKYQTINSTLQEAVDKGVVSSAEKFTAEVQERIFKQYLVAIKRPEIKGFITGSNNATLNDALLGSAKEFASVANPSTGKSYYAGQGNNKASISAEKMTESLLAQQKVYRENIALGMDSEQAWLKSFNASTTVVKTEEVDLDKFLEDMIKRKQEQADEQKAIQVNYYNEWQKLEFDNQEKIKEIEKAFATDPTERDRLLELQQKAYEDDVANWVKAQDERVKAENEANQQIILARQNAFAMMNGPLGAMVQMGVEASARASMNPEEYQRWQLGNDQQSGYSQLADNLYSAREGIQNDEYTTDTEKYQQLEQAYEVYLQNKAALSEAYSKQEQDLAKTQYESQLSLWGNLLGQAQNTFSQLTQSLKKSAGEQSTTYKTMFALQQGFSVASSLVAAYTAYAQAFADPSAMTLPQKFLGATAVMAALTPALATIASVSIDGMAHDGIDNIPKEGTWLLDKGERVVDSRTNADLKNMIANQNNNGPQININVPPGYTAEQSRGADGAVTIDIVEKQIKRSWGNLSNPNSYESKQIQRNTTAGVKR
ncbi:tape measure protein [Acinetobacter variabilis]|uniref:tape measure protein n=1 Tax=Acinetobacter variabilis TaxID=70346 RepID=UPI0030F8D14F